MLYTDTLLERSKYGPCLTTKLAHVASACLLVCNKKPSENTFVGTRRVSARWRILIVDPEYILIVTEGLNRAWTYHLHIINNEG